MNNSRGNNKTKCGKSEDVDDAESNLKLLSSLTSINPGSQEGSGNDADKTVEQIVFGNNVRPDGSMAPVFRNRRQEPQRGAAQGQRANRSRNSDGQDLDQSFRPLASSSFSEPGISRPVALNLSSPVNISAINYPQPSPLLHQTTVHSPPPIIRRPATQQFTSTTLPSYGTPRAPVSAASRTLPLPRSQTSPPSRVPYQPPVQRIATSPPPGASTSYPGFQAPMRHIPQGNRTIATSGLTAPYQPVPASSLSTSREQELKQRLEHVENQIARVALSLQSQGIDTEMSEESQIRLISYLQKRLQDLEAKVAEMGGYSNSGEDSLERRKNSGRQEDTLPTLFKLQDLITKGH